MPDVTTETILAIILSITGSITVIGVIVICYVLFRDFKSRHGDNRRTQSDERQKGPGKQCQRNQQQNLRHQQENASTILRSNDGAIVGNKLSISPIDTLSLSYYDDDFYTNDEHFPRIRKFSSSSISADKDDDTADILTTNNFDDNWSFAMTEEGSQLVTSRWQITSQSSHEASKVVAEPSNKADDPDDVKNVALIAESSAVTKLRIIIDYDGRPLYEV